MGLDWRKAELDKVVKGSADLARGYVELGEEYYKRNELVKAVECYRRAVDIESVSATALFGLWRAYKALGDRVNAQGACNKYKRATSALVSCE